MAFFVYSFSRDCVRGLKGAKRRKIAVSLGSCGGEIVVAVAVFARESEKEAKLLLCEYRWYRDMSPCVLLHTGFFVLFAAQYGVALR